MVAKVRYFWRFHYTAAESAGENLDGLLKGGGKVVKGVESGFRHLDGGAAISGRSRT